MAEVADSPDIVWKSAKSFMRWKSKGTPSQLNIANKLVTSAKLIAQSMNEFVINKVRIIREGMESVPFNFNKVNEIMNILMQELCQILVLSPVPP